MWLINTLIAIGLVQLGATFGVVLMCILQAGKEEGESNDPE